jgi:hypothetical protein
MNRGKRRRHQCRGKAESCPWPGAEQSREKRRARLGAADNTNVMETDDYRRQGVGTSSRGTSDRGTESRIAAQWISQYVRSSKSMDGKRITAAPRHAGGGHPARTQR